MTLGELAGGAVATLAAATLCTGTMRAEYLPAGTRVRVSWQGQISTFVTPLDGDRAGQLLPCPQDAVIREEDLARAEGDVRGSKQDGDPLDPLLRPTEQLDLTQKEQRPAVAGEKDAKQRKPREPARAPTRGKQK